MTEKAGIFSLKGKAGTVKAGAPDGSYRNLIDGETVFVRDGVLFCSGKPVIITWPSARQEQIGAV